MIANQPMRVATYTRISTDEEHQPYSLEAQRERLGSYIRIQDGWELVRRFTDQMSGSTLERPGLQQALSEARLHKYDLLLVYRVDRLARSVRGLAQILDELAQAHVTFRSATEPFETASPAGRMMIQMLGVFAEFERATLIDRVVAGMERKAARGGWCGGTIPYGYRLNKETGFLEVEENEAPIVTRIFDLYLNGRLGAKAIANWLNEHSHKTRGGRPWSFLAVLTVLKNKSYSGRIYFRGEYYPAPHVALVQEEQLQSAHQLLALRSGDYTKRRSNPTDYLAGGITKCAKCSRHYGGTAAHGKRQRYRYYTCLSHMRRGLHGCGNDRVRADKLDEALEKAILETYENTDVLMDGLRLAWEEANADRPKHDAELAKVEADIQKAESARQRYYRAFESGAMTEADCGARLRALTDSLADLECRAGELRRTLAAEAFAMPSADELKALGAHVRERLENGTPQERKGLVQALVPQVVIHSRDEIYPYFRVPASVRVLYGVVDPRGFEPLTF